MNRLIFHNMEKNQIADLLQNFDQFVQLSLQHKTSSSPEQEQQQENHLDYYLAGMEKRLRLKPPTQQEKFEKMLGPMKNLKSFVSVKDFIQKVGYSNGFAKKAKKQRENGEPSVKQQYQNVRGGYYLHRIQDHLKRKNYRRQQQQTFYTEIDRDPLHPSQYCNWAQNILGRVSPKQESLFRVSTEQRGQTKMDEEDCLIQEHKKTYHQQYQVVPRIRQMCTQEYQKFTKVSTLLTNRLRKILNNNCASRNSKVELPTKMTADSKRLFSQRVTVGLRREAKTIKNAKQQGLRAKTAGSCRKEDAGWRENINKRIKLILQTESNPDH